jgi:predicted secreted protein
MNSMNTLFKIFFIFACIAIHTETSAEQHILKIGTIFHLELPSNPTTGYSWYLSQPLPQNAPISIQKSGYHAPKRRRIGSGGTQFWDIKAQHRGKATLTLEYKRAWGKRYFTGRNKGI